MPSTYSVTSTCSLDRLGDHLRDHDERMPAPGARERAVGLGLELVVELLGEALADLLRHRLRVHAGRQHLRHPQDQARGSAGRRARRCAMPGYWILTATRRPSCSRARYTWPIDAAANASGSNSANTSSSGSLQVGLDHLAHLLERARAAPSRAAWRASPRAAVDLRRQRARVDERRHLADLHRGALHLPEHVEDALGHLELAPLGRLAALLLRAGEVGGAGRVGACRLCRRRARRCGRSGAAGRWGSSPWPCSDRSGRAVRPGSHIPPGVGDRLRRDGRGRPLPARAAMEGADPRLRHRGARHGARARDEGTPARPGGRGAGRRRCSTSAPGRAPWRSGSSSGCPEATVTGLDADPEVLARARRKAADAGCEIDFVEGFSTELPFAADSFDVVLSSLFFHHLMPRRQAQHARRGAAGAEARREPARRRLGQARRPADGRALPLDPGLRRLRGHRREPARRPALPLRAGGLENAQERRRLRTTLGTLALYSARKPA